MDHHFYFGIKKSSELLTFLDFLDFFWDFLDIFETFHHFWTSHVLHCVLCSGGDKETREGLLRKNSNKKAFERPPFYILSLQRKSDFSRLFFGFFETFHKFWTSHCNVYCGDKETPYDAKTQTKRPLKGRLSTVTRKKIGKER
jgi:hypothetical protein